jgi:hypothetical protein
VEIRGQIALLSRLVKAFKPAAQDSFSAGGKNFIFAKRLCAGRAEW